MQVNLQLHHFLCTSHMIAGVQGQRCLVYEYKSARFIPEVESNQKMCLKKKIPYIHLFYPLDMTLYLCCSHLM